MRAGGQTALARLADIPQSTLRGYTTRRREPPRDILVRLAAASGVSTLWLITGEGPIVASKAEASQIPQESDLDTESSALFDAIAKKFSVPFEFARARLLGSVELEALETAMEQWGPSRPIPVAGTEKRRIWGVLSREDAEKAAPGSKLTDLEAYRVQTENLAPQFHTGDWALVDRAKDLEAGKYLFIRKSHHQLEVRQVSLKPGLISLSGSRDAAGFGPGHDFSDKDALLRFFDIVGRLVGAIRFVPDSHSSKYPPLPHDR